MPKRIALRHFPVLDRERISGCNPQNHIFRKLIEPSFGKRLIKVIRTHFQLRQSVSLSYNARSRIKERMQLRNEGDRPLTCGNRNKITFDIRAARFLFSVRQHTGLGTTLYLAAHNIRNAIEHSRDAHDRLKGRFPPVRQIVATKWQAMWVHSGNETINTFIFRTSRQMVIGPLLNRTIFLNDILPVFEMMTANNSR